MTTLNRKKKICIFGANVGNMNLGDEATFSVVLQNIRQNFAEAEVFGICKNPGDTTERFRIAAFPIRKPKKKTKNEMLAPEWKVNSQNGIHWNMLVGRIKLKLKKMPFLRVFFKTLRNTLKRGSYIISEILGEIWFVARSFSYLRNTDLFIVAGSGLLSDHYGGMWNFPYSIFKWSTLARLVGAKIAFLSVGVGPIKSPLSKHLVKWSLSLADYRSFRDEDSRKLVERIGLKDGHRVSPDLVHGLIAGDQRNTLSAKRAECIVGINPLPQWDPRFWPVADEMLYHKYIKKLASFALWLMENDHRVLFFPTQLWDDPPVIRDIKDILQNDLGGAFHEDPLEMPIKELDELLFQISVTDFVVATRFHGMLLSFLMDKPVLGISNQPKMGNLMRDMGQACYLLNMDTFNVEDLKDRFVSLKSNSRSIEENLRLIRSNHCTALEKQYEELFGLLKRRGRS